MFGMQTGMEVAIQGYRARKSLELLGHSLSLSFLIYQMVKSKAFMGIKSDASHGALSTRQWSVTGLGGLASGARGGRGWGGPAEPVEEPWKAVRLICTISMKPITVTPPATPGPGSVIGSLQFSRVRSDHCTEEQPRCSRGAAEGRRVGSRQPGLV